MIMLMLSPIVKMGVSASREQAQAKPRLGRHVFHYGKLALYQLS